MNSAVASHIPGLGVACLHGGTSIAAQKRALREQGAIVAVGTPGRTVRVVVLDLLLLCVVANRLAGQKKQLLEAGVLDTSNIAVLVLDEADKLIGTV